MSDFLGYTIYYIVFISVAVAAFLRIIGLISTNKLLWIVGFIFIVLSAFRGSGIDKDYENYVTSIDSFDKPIDYFLNFDDWFFFEFFFYQIPTLYKFIISGQSLYLFFFFTLISIAIALQFSAIKIFSSFVGLSIFVYSSNYFFLHGLTQMRAGVAAGFLLWCIYFHYIKNYKYFFLALTISFLFHYSSILFLLLLLLDPKEFSKRKAYSAIIISLILLIVKTDFIITPFLQLNFPFVQKLSMILQAMKEDENVFNTFNVGFLINLVTTVLLIFYHESIKSHNKYATILIKVQVLSIFLYALFSSIAIVAFRVSELFGVVQYLTVPLLIFVFKQKRVGVFYVAIYSIAFFLLNVHFVKLVEPFKFFFFAR